MRKRAAPFPCIGWREALRANACARRRMGFPPHRQQHDRFGCGVFGVPFVDGVRRWLPFFGKVGR